jgi:hypothetical protein
MQTSFLHPPFGFALFYLRSVAPRSVRTGEIYWGAIPFVAIQVLMIALVIAFPGMVTGNITHVQAVKGTGADELRRQIENPGGLPGGATPAVPAAPGTSKSDDSGAELERLLKGSQ